jgi:hypothetical protein
LVARMVEALNTAMGISMVWCTHLMLKLKIHIISTSTIISPRNVASLEFETHHFATSHLRKYGNTKKFEIISDPQ